MKPARWSEPRRTYLCAGCGWDLQARRWPMPDGSAIVGFDQGWTQRDGWLTYAKPRRHRHVVTDDGWELTVTGRTDGWYLLPARLHCPRCSREVTI